MKLTVNGEGRQVDDDPLASLLSVLREKLGITSPKAGCEQGGCGACTVLVDGQPVRSCLTPVARVDGASVTTVEGLGNGHELTPLQQAFYAKYGAQCGYCTSGMILAATHLLDQHPGEPVTREQIEFEMGGHLCRCTGYVKIIEAVQAAANGERFDLAELRVSGVAAGGGTTPIIGAEEAEA